MSSHLLVEVDGKCTTQTVGRSLMIIEKYYKEVFASNQPRELSLALRRVLYLLNDPDTCTTVAADMLETSIRRLPSAPSKYRRSPCFVVFCYFLEQFHATLFAPAFSDLFLNGKDKAFVMACSEFLYQCLEQQRAIFLSFRETNSLSDLNTRSVATSVSVNYKMIYSLLEDIILAVTIHSANEGTKKLPTRLSMSLLQLSWNASRFICQYDIEKNRSTLLEKAPSLQQLVKMSITYHDRFPLYSLALEQIYRFLSFFGEWKKNLCTTGDLSKVHERDAALGFSVRWQDYASLLLLQTKRASSITPILQNHLQYTVPGACDSDSIMHHHLLCIALILGKTKRLDPYISSFEEYNFLPTLQGVLVGAKNEDLKNLSSHLFGSLIGLLLPTEDWEGQTEKLFKVLEKRDFISDAVIVLLARIVLQNPFDNVGRIFSHLQSANVALKENSLRLLSALFRLAREENQTLTLLFEKEIVSHILSYTEYFTIPLRNESAKVFAFISPFVLFPHIITSLLSQSKRDTRTRSLLLFYYKEALFTHQHPLQAIEALLDAVRHATLSAPSLPISPSDIFSKKREDEKPLDQNLIRQLFQNITEWTNDVLPSSMQNDFLMFLIAQFLEHPTCSITISFATQCSSFFGSHAPVVFDRIHKYVSVQKEVEQDDLFVRLSPLLLLRILPVSAYQLFDSEPLRECLFSLSFRKDVKEIRKLAVELLARFPCQNSFQTFCDEFEKQVRVLDDMDSMKLCIFYFCNYMTVNVPAGEGSQWESVPALFSSLQILLDFPDEHEEIQKLQRGCVDCIGVLFGASSLSEHRPTFNMIMNIIYSYETSLRCSIRTLSAIIALIPRMSAHSLQCVARWELMAILSSLSISLHKASPPYIAGILQFVFVLTFHLAAEVKPFALDLFLCSIDACKHREHSIRLGGLKIVGTLMGIGALEESNSFDGSHIQSLQTTLEGLSNIDPAKQVRELAETMLETITQIPSQ